MEVFTLCNCNNLISSYTVHNKQKQIAVTIRNNAQCERAFRNIIPVLLLLEGYYITLSDFQTD